MNGIEECSPDVWGEKYCSMNTRFRPIIEDNGKPVSIRSCSLAQSKDPNTFNYVRKLVEKQPWTVTEMSKALKLIFNCTGKISAKISAQECAQS